MAATPPPSGGPGTWGSFFPWPHRSPDGFLTPTPPASSSIAPRPGCWPGGGPCQRREAGAAPLCSRTCSGPAPERGSASGVGLRAKARERPGQGGWQPAHLGAIWPGAAPSTWARREAARGSWDPHLGVPGGPWESGAPCLQGSRISGVGSKPARAGQWGPPPGLPTRHPGARRGAGPLGRPHGPSLVSRPPALGSRGPTRVVLPGASA